MQLLKKMSSSEVSSNEVSSEEYDVLAWTTDFDMIVTEDMEGLCYGLYNRNTGVVEFMSNVFSNTVQMLETLQEAYESAQAVLDEDGRLNLDAMPLLNAKENIH